MFLIVNGDCLGFDDVDYMLVVFGVDGVMIGCVVYGKLWFLGYVGYYLNIGNWMLVLFGGEFVDFVIEYNEVILDCYGE